MPPIRSRNWKRPHEARLQQAETRLTTAAGASRSTAGRCAPRANASWSCRARRSPRAIAAEWDAQQDEIRPATMPLTRLAATAIDRTAPQRDRGRRRDRRVRRHRSRLLPRRATAGAGGAPTGGMAAADRLGGRCATTRALAVTTGVIPARQSPAALRAFAAAVAAQDDFRADRAARPDRGLWLVGHRARVTRKPARCRGGLRRLAARRDLPDRGLGRRRRSGRPPPRPSPPTSPPRHGSRRCCGAEPIYGRRYSSTANAGSLGGPAFVSRRAG